jgi:hypothetical protein
MRERLKRKIMAGSKGGNPGQWSARKAQLLAAEYEKAGGGYIGSRSASQRSLSKWSKQDWRTKSGKPSLETGERYLPAAAIAALTSAEYAETSRAKRTASGQFSRQPKRIAMKTKEFRNPLTYPADQITYAALTPTPANTDIAAGKTLWETPAFKKWFGDSKVRDLASRPAVLYHGTCSSGFTKFDPTKTREGMRNLSRKNTRHLPGLPFDSKAAVHTGCLQRIAYLLHRVAGENQSHLRLVH